MGAYPLVQFAPDLEGVRNVGTIVGTVASLIIGAAVASVTVFGVVSSQTNAPADSPANVNQPVIDYGSTGN